MREIVLDTEATGFDPTTGDRIVDLPDFEFLWRVERLADNCAHG